MSERSYVMMITRTRKRECSKMKKELNLAKITMQVDNLKNMKGFYQDLFKMYLVSENETEASFAFFEGGAVVFVLKEINPNIPRDPYTGLYHFAFLFEKEADMASLVTHLLESGYPLSGAADHLVSHAVYLQDPEGNDIELYADMPADLWHWERGQVVMDTLPLDMQQLVNMSHPWIGFPKEVTIGHLHFYGADLKAADAFIQNILMMDKVSSLGQHANFYSINDYHHHVAVNGWKPTQPLDVRKDLLGLSEWVIEVNAEYYDQIVQNLHDNEIEYSEKDGVISVKDSLDIPLVIIKK